MTQGPVHFPVFNPMLSRAVGLLPMMPLTLALSALARRISVRHPRILRRLAGSIDKRFAIDPTDLPFVLLMDFPGGTPRITVQRNADGADCRIAGTLSALLGLVHGSCDGDALFFSRDLVIEGDTSATLALRNAIDDAELDLSEEVASLTPPLAGLIGQFAAICERRTGLSLQRAKGGM